MSRIAKMLVLCAVLAAPAAVHAADCGSLPPFTAQYWTSGVSAQDYALEGDALLAANPGETIIIHNLTQPLFEGHSVVKLESITGASVNIPENVLDYGDPSGGSTPISILSLPFTFDFAAPGYTSDFRINAKVDPLDKSGKPHPVVLKWSIDLSDAGGTCAYPHLVASSTYTLPVTAGPKLYVAAQALTSQPGVVHPSSVVTYLFTAQAAGGTMTGLQYKARIPKGSTLRPGTINPPDGALSGSEVTWTTSASVKTFTCGFAVKFDGRPGTKTAKTTYGAQAEILGHKQTAKGTNSVPITGYDSGLLTYRSAKGVDAAVQVGETATFTCNGWDFEGGDVDVTLNGEKIGTATATQTSGTFVVPPFKDDSLEHLLTARQGPGKPVDDPMSGTALAVAELASGQVEIVDGEGNVARRVAMGEKVAVGEVTIPADFAGATEFGDLRVVGATSAVVLAYAPTGPTVPADTRLIVAKGGDVRIYGVVRPGKLVVQAGHHVLSETFAPQDLSGFDTSSQPGVVSLMSPTTSVELTGYSYSPSQVWTVSGDVTMNGGVLFTLGGATIAGALNGSGSFICSTDLTLQGTAAFNGSALGSSPTLAVGGTLTIGK